MSNTINYYKLYRNEMIPLLPKQYSKVLEIGCGEGNFRENLSQENEYWGVEPIKSAANIASQKLYKVLVGTYQETFNQIPDDYFDLVICNDVIEHMIDHDEFLQSIKQKLKNNSYLVASIPNVRYVENLFEVLIQKDWEYKDRGILDRTHLRFFTKKSLYRTIDNNGFFIEDFIGINSYTINGLLKRCLFYFALFLFGEDIRFKQFGIRISCGIEPSTTP
jgi:2-polyprenyl-3-methyl-5-hydroxy-6-metoxy-1,4-benzoquinol methylase